MYHLIENLKNTQTIEALIFAINALLAVSSTIMYFLNAIIIKFTVIKNIEKHYKVKLIPFPNTMGGFRLEYSCIALELAFYVPYCFIKKLFTTEEKNNSHEIKIEKAENKNTNLKKVIKKKKSKKYLLSS